mmetsp:Transcript_52888/g.96805  ORF Transcript_52888/g.96805 Transcript_52888/m.96805 type:complete len:87 (-) Transcript_52888:63-323(-)
MGMCRVLSQIQPNATIDVPECMITMMRHDQFHHSVCETQDQNYAADQSYEQMSPDLSFELLRMLLNIMNCKTFQFARKRENVSDFK